MQRAISNSTLYLICCGFRNAIDNCEKQSFSIGLREFPIGACGDCSLLLGAYLADMNYRLIQYVMGEKDGGSQGKYKTHAWLEYESTIIDITADQFHEIDDRVIVTSDSEWHKEWEATYSNASDFRGYDGSTAATLARYFSLIHSRL